MITITALQYLVGKIRLRAKAGASIEIKIVKAWTTKQVLYLKVPTSIFTPSGKKKRNVNDRTKK